MAKNTISKPTTDAVVFPLNHRAWGSSFTVQNLTDAALVIKVTNENVQTVASPTFDDPNGTPVSISANDTARISGPYVAAEFSGTGTGEIAVAELY